MALHDYSILVRKFFFTNIGIDSINNQSYSITTISK